MWVLDDIAGIIDRSTDDFELFQNAQHLIAWHGTDPALDDFLEFGVIFHSGGIGGIAFVGFHFWFAHGIKQSHRDGLGRGRNREPLAIPGLINAARDRKSTRLNSSHVASSYAVFSLKKKNKR